MSLNSTPATFTAGEVVPASKLNAEIRDAFAGIEAAWDAYTPALTAITLGNGTVAAKWRRVGQTVQGRIDFTAGSTTSYTAGTNFAFSLPTAAHPLSLAGSVLGGAALYDDSAGGASRISGTAILNATLAAVSVLIDSKTSTASVTSTNPWTWATSDTISIVFEYEANDPPSVVPGTTQGVYLTGTGSPQGVISAPVGTHYVDTAATLGAVEWTKATGTGNTGWKVTYGDTGRRELKASLVNGWTAGSLSLQRVNNRVNLVAQTLNASAKTSNTLLTLPAGFTNQSSEVLVIPVYDAAVLRQLVVVGTLACDASGSSTFILGTWLTADDWPTSLPGTPA